MCVGGGDFRVVGGGSLAHGRFLQVQSHVLVERQASFCLREPGAGPNVCGVQCDRDRSAVSVPPFKLGASPPQKKFVASRDPSILLLVIR